METWWWIALCAVMLLALLTTLVDGAGRLAQRRDRYGHRTRSTRNARLPSRTNEPSTPANTAGASGSAPRPGEIWTAALPNRALEGKSAEDTAATEGACLVLAVGADAVRAVPVLAPDGRPATYGPAGPDELDRLQQADRLASDTVLTLPWTSLGRRAGLVAPALWDQVRYLAD